MDAGWVFRVFFEGIEEGGIGVREPPDSNGDVREGMSDLGEGVDFWDDKQVLGVVLDRVGDLQVGEVCVEGDRLIRGNVIEESGMGV